MSRRPEAPDNSAINTMPLNPTSYRQVFEAMITTTPLRYQSPMLSAARNNFQENYTINIRETCIAH